ncbi:uncharacterized protein METZ01_LOCUS198910, partial [marine metagenome]
MLTNTVEDLLEQGRAALGASRILARLSGNVKNQALLNIAEALETQQDDVLEANEADCRLAKADGISESVLERLLLTPDRLRGTAAEVR